MALDKLNTRRYREQRERIFSRDGRVCQICGTDEGEMHIDHIIPRKAGGDHSMDNLRVLCKACNLRKGALNDGVFLSNKLIYRVGYRSYFSSGAGKNYPNSFS